jgi:hypothetical protein
MRLPWHSSHYDLDVTSRLAQAVIQMQKTSVILLAVFLIRVLPQSQEMPWSVPL